MCSLAVNFVTYRLFAVRVTSVCRKRPHSLLTLSFLPAGERDSLLLLSALACGGVSAQHRHRASGAWTLVAKCSSQPLFLKVFLVLRPVYIILLLQHIIKPCYKATYFFCKTTSPQKLCSKFHFFFTFKFHCWQIFDCPFSDMFIWFSLPYLCSCSRMALH